MRGIVLVLVAVFALVSVTTSASGKPSPEDKLAEADALDEKVFELYGAGKFKEALSSAERSLVLREGVVGTDDVTVAESLNNIAAILDSMGSYGRAETIYKKALGIREEKLGPDHPDTAESLNNLGYLYKSIGDFQRAEPLYQRALSIRERKLGAEHLDTARSANNLAVLYQNKGDYLGAESLLQKALGIFEKKVGPRHPRVAMALNNLALLYTEMGAYKRAEPLAERGLRIFEEAFGDHPLTATALNSLAGIYDNMGTYSRSESLYLRALKIREDKFGHDHSQTAHSLNNLAGLYVEMKAYSKAEPLFLRALKIYEANFGSDHPVIATSLNNLASLHNSEGRYSEAEPLYKRSLRIREEKFGPDHPQTARSRRNLATLYQATGDISQAVALLERAEAGEERFLETTLTGLSEARRKALVKTLEGSTHALYSLHARLATDKSQARDLALRALLRRKGRVLEAGTQTMRTLRKKLNPETQSLFDELSILRSKLAKLVLGGPGKDVDGYRGQVKSLQGEVEALEEQLVKESKAFAQHRTVVTIDAVQRAIPQGAALIEFAWYRPYLTEKSAAKRWGQARYSAYILRASGEPSFVDLGPAKAIDSAVQKARVDLADDRADPKLAGQALFDQVIRPLLPHLEGASTLLLSPDGQLNLAPLHAAVDAKGRYLLENYSISYLTSGRDLLRYVHAIESPSGPTIVANPSFNPKRGTSNNAPAHSVDKSELHFSPLPATAHEAKRLHSMLPDAQVLLATDATEGALKMVIGPRILHLATHGAFLPDAKGMDKNPLLRSLLAFAGANPPHGTEEDGILTAYEASGLNLYGTKLVVLSACETAVGEVKNGEGVYGLRRAFVLAGAETLAMSLWKVDDAVTQKLMVSYYEKLLAGEGRAEALRLAQLELLNGEYAHPYYWAAFSSIGNTAPLDGKSAKLPQLKQRPRGCGGCSTGTDSGSVLILVLALWWLRQRRRCGKLGN